MKGIQLPLGIALRPAATFASFVAGPNAALLHALSSMGDGEGLYLWGGAGTGKTHLLQAVCHQTAGDRRAFYLPLDRLDELTPAVLEGLEAMSCVCVDDLQAIRGRDGWERGLFTLFNALREAGGRLILAADRAPRSLGLQLPDLASRLGWGPVFHVQGLDDRQLAEALRLRARGLGLDMPEEVAQYLLRRFVRDTAALFDLLEELDRASLSERRRLTIPFVKAALDREGGG